MGKGKILIVDDEPLTCQLISKVLKLNGYTSDVLTDSRQIADRAMAVHPDLILLDYHLGVEFGLDVLNALKQNSAISNIPVVITSGIDHRSKVMAAGAAGFLQKPFDWTELVSVLEKLLPNGATQATDGTPMASE